MRRQMTMGTRLSSEQVRRAAGWCGRPGGRSTWPNAMRTVILAKESAVGRDGWRAAEAGCSQSGLQVAGIRRVRPRGISAAHSPRPH